METASTSETLLIQCFPYFHVLFHTAVHTKWELPGSQWFRLDQGTRIHILVPASTSYMTFARHCSETALA